jgi:alkanesulfonate monooxygenase
MEDLTARAAQYGRTLDYGLRVHMIVRETEAEARAYAKKLVSKLDEVFGTEIRNRAQDAKTLGVALQAQAREEADEEGFVEPLMWTGIGRARSGCGAALVGDPDQILAKIKRYMEMGIRAFIFSGYPHADECNLFGKYVLPQLKTISMPQVQGRIPETTPATPLGVGVRR